MPLLAMLGLTAGAIALATPSLARQTPPPVPKPSMPRIETQTIHPVPIPTPPSVPTPPGGGFGWGARPSPTPSLPPLKGGSVAGAVRILSQTLSYDRKASLAVLRGNVRIYQEDTTIEAAEVRHDSKNKISTINVPFKLVQTKPPDPPTTLKGDNLVFYHNEKRVFVNGHVWLLREGVPGARPQGPSKKDKLKAALKHEDTQITSQEMTYWTGKKDADFKGTVVAEQKEKKAEGDHAFLDNTKKHIYMDGNVVLTQIKGDWLVREGIVDTSKPDPERDKAIQEKSVSKGDKLDIDQTTNDSVLTGNLVTIDQKDRHATGKKAVYSDSQQTITLTENVRILRGPGDWINADRAVFHTDSDRFEAFGEKGNQVETEFILQDEKGNPK
jgi:lipopolysaccharide export system protein LptA